MNNFYVYMYSHENIPFYVGKGSGDRYKIHGHLLQNRFLKNKIAKVGVGDVQINLLCANLTEEQSFYLEEYYIAGIGRRDKGLGPLCNLTNGGDGSSGLKTSEETKRKLSASLKGRKFSDEHKRKLSIAGKSRVCSGETRLKISATRRSQNKHYKHSKEAKLKISVANKGKVRSVESRKKMSESHKKRQFGYRVV
jgi:hypothetical protein